MGRRRIGVGILAALAMGCGCDRQTPVPAARTADARDAGQVQVPVGGAKRDPSQEHRLAFRIERVLENRRPTTSPPWHEPGGDWTFFDAATHDGVRFGFGYVAPSSTESFRFGRALLTVPDAEHGARLVAAVAQAFRVEPPAERARLPLRHRPLGMAVLAEDARPLLGGGFEGQGGTWTATKLFLGREALVAEVFFNFDLDGMRGAFDEKDAEYAADLVGLLALEVRDGPRPARTPETDPQITLTGPKVPEWRLLARGQAQARVFERGNTRFVYSVPRDDGGTELLSASLTDAGDVEPILSVDDRIGSFVCAERRPDTCLVMLLRAAKTLSTGAATSFVVVDRKARTQSKLALGGELLLAEQPVSPDGRVVAITRFRGSEPRYTVLCFVTVATGAEMCLESFARPMNVVGWTTAGDQPRAVVRQGLPWDETPPAYLVVDPRDGNVEGPATAPRGDPNLAPDGKHSVDCETEDTIVVRRVPDGASRSFLLHEDDRYALDEECVFWLGPRHLALYTSRMGIIDVESMKMSYPFPEDEDFTATFSDDMKWAVAHRDDGLYVGRVVVK
jgi:hypothetical protein